MSSDLVVKQYARYDYKSSSKADTAKKVGLAIASELGDEGAITKVVKLIKNTLDMLKNISSLPLDRDGIGHFKTATDMVKALGMFTSIKSLVDAIGQKPSPESKHPRLDTHLRSLKIAASVVGIADGATGVANLLHTFKVIDLAKITIKLGNMPILGNATAALTAGSIFNVLAIAKAGLDIGMSSIRLHILRKAESRIQSKTSYWKDPELSTDFAKKRIEHFKQKQNDFADTSARLEEMLDLSDNAVKVTEASWKASSDKTAKKAWKESVKSHNKLMDRYEFIQEKQKALSAKIDKWAETKFLPQDVEKYKDGKLKKWNVKLQNVNLNKLKEGLGIALNTLVIITLIAAIILTTIGLGGIPAIAISLTAVVLTLTAAGIAHGLFKKYAKERTVPQVELPLFSKKKPKRLRALSLPNLATCAI